MLGSSVRIVPAAAFLGFTAGASHFSPDLEALREPSAMQSLLGNGKRHGSYGAHITGDVLARDSITARQGSLQPRSAGAPRLILQRQRNAIHLQFTHETHFSRAHCGPHTALPIPQFLFAVHVVERKHGPRMVHLGEALFGLATYALTGRVRRHQLGMAAFEHAQLPHPGVVLRVSDFRGIQHVILIFVVAELIAQFVDSFGIVLLNRAGLGSSFGHSVHYRNVRSGRPSCRP
jgi:hypothetical protein